MQPPSFCLAFCTGTTTCPLYRGPSAATAEPAGISWIQKSWVLVSWALPFFTVQSGKSPYLSEP